MRTVSVAILALLCAGCGDEPSLSAAGPATSDQASSDAKAIQPGSTMPPLERVKATEKGKLKNPYSHENQTVVEEGRKIYLGYSCNGCHGGGGGGGMCPPLSNEVWVYGKDDDTLFRLVTLGTDELQKQGYTRKGSEGVVGPMVPFHALIKTEDELWKMITFIRSANPDSAK
ncbi:MAG: c-type cytochrome [Pyrinomonadaceae bacterium]